MRRLMVCILAFCVMTNEALAQSNSDSIEARNKEIALNFYRDLWLSNNTDKYALYVADEYVVHDTGDRKAVTEPAIVQKQIADFFWKNGDLSGTIDYQIAEGDLVATRWLVDLAPKTLFGKYMLSPMQIPIINVFRFNEEGKIVEIWNHRHDIDTGQSKIFVFKGIGIGLAIAFGVALLVYVLRRWRKSSAV